MTLFQISRLRFITLYFSCFSMRDAHYISLFFILAWEYLLSYFVCSHLFAIFFLHTGSFIDKFYHFVSKWPIISIGRATTGHAIILSTRIWPHARIRWASFIIPPRFAALRSLADVAQWPYTSAPSFTLTAACRRESTNNFHLPLS